jgi:thiamine biosynthesis lipoprotein
MRTRFEVLIADEGRDPADLRAAAESALAEVAEPEARLSVYRPDAALFAVNARAHAAPVPVDAPTFALLERAARLAEATGGAFDLTVGPLLALWGLAGDGEGNVPTDEEVAAALRLVGMGRVVRLDPDARTVAFALPGVRLDPGALGKGYALERARDALREAGVRNALLHGGTSSVCALGAPGGTSDGWRVALQHPLDPGARLAAVTLWDGDALGVSAAHGKTFHAADGRRFGHVLDPRTGRPADAALLAAAVLPDAAADADAVSTALLVRGVEGLEPLAAAFPGAALLVAWGDGIGVTVRTAGTPDGGQAFHTSTR